MPSGNYLFRKLEQHLLGLLAPRYRGLIFEQGEAYQVVPDLEVGAAEVVRDVVSEVGNADIISDGVTDIPIVDVSAEEDRYRVVMFASAYGYTFQQYRAMLKGKIPINERKLALARRAIAERMNRWGAYGDRRNGATGMVNNANVTVDNVSFNPFAAGTTPDDVAAFIIDNVETMHTASNDIEMATDLLVSNELYFRLIKMRMPDSSTTVLDYVQKALSDNGFNFNIRKAQELRSANLEKYGVQATGTNKDRMILYVKNPDTIEQHTELTQLMPEDFMEVREGRKIVALFSCATPVIINYPQAVRYIDHAKAA